MKLHTDDMQPLQNSKSRLSRFWFVLIL